MKDDPWLFVFLLLFCFLHFLVSNFKIKKITCLIKRDWIERIDIEATHASVERCWAPTSVNMTELHLLKDLQGFHPVASNGTAERIVEVVEAAK